MVRHAGLLYKPSLIIYGQVYNLTSSFFIYRQLLRVLDEKFLQDCPVNIFVPPSPIVRPTSFRTSINDHTDFFCNTVIFATCY